MQLSSISLHGATLLQFHKINVCAVLCDETTVWVNPLIFHQWFNKGKLNINIERLQVLKILFSLVAEICESFVFSYWLCKGKVKICLYKKWVYLLTSGLKTFSITHYILQLQRKALSYVLSQLLGTSKPILISAETASECLPPITW